MKRWLLAALLAVLSLPLGAQVFTRQAAYYLNTYALDTFPYTNGVLAGNGNWVTEPSLVTLNVVGNQLECASIGSTDCGNLYNLAIFPNDQCAQSTIVTLNAVDSATMEIKARVSLSANTYYAAFIKGPLGSSAQISIGKVIAGSFTSLVSFTSETINSGDIVTFCAQGTNLYTSIRGTVVPALSSTDSSIASGVPGIGIQSNGQAQTDVVLGKWSGFYIGTTAPTGSGSATQIKWHPGYYAASNTYVEPGNPNKSYIQSEIALVRAGPSQVLGYVPSWWWNTFENATAGLYDFSTIDQIYVQLLTGSTTWSGGAMPALSSPRRLGIYFTNGWYFNSGASTVTPTYITSSSTYGPLGPDGVHYGYWTSNGSSGPCTGSVTALWRPAVMARLVALGRAMATHVLPDGYTLDSSPYVEMIGLLNETAELAPGATCGTDSSYSASTANAQIQALNTALGPLGAGAAFPHTNVQSYINYAPGGPDETQTLMYTLASTGTAAAGPDTFGLSSGNNSGVTPCSTGLCGLTWGQAAYIGNTSPGDAHYSNLWTVGGSTDWRGTIAGMYQVQGTELGDDVTYTPSDIFGQLNTTLHATHAIWSLLPPGTFTGGAVNGNWWGTCSSQSAWNAAPSTCGGVLYILTTDPLSTTACPSTYVGGCNTSYNLPAENDDHFHQVLDGRLREAA